MSELEVELLKHFEISKRQEVEVYLAGFLLQTFGSDI
jgi:hypothetical protein